MDYCACGRTKLDIVDEQCGVCKAAKTIVIKCAKEKKLSDEVIFLFKPIICSKCNERFSDVTNLKAHTDIAHCSQTLATESTKSSHSLIKTRLKSMSVTDSSIARKKILVMLLVFAGYQSHEAPPWLAPSEKNFEN